MSSGVPDTVSKTFGTTVALALVAALVYANSLANGFVLDDRGIILDNPLVQHPAAAWRAFTSPYGPGAVGGGQYRPLGILAFALDRALAGNSAVWFHTMNVAWYAVVVILVHRFALAWLAPAGAAVAALIFAVHPVHDEAVANVVGRLELMAATFGLAALLLHRRGHWSAAALYACALLSKEHAIVIPLLALAQDLVSGSRSRARGHTRALYVAYGAVSVVWMTLMLYALREGPIRATSAVFQDQDFDTRLLTVLSVVPHYVRLLLAPFSLSSDYEPNVVSPATPASPMPYIGAAILVAWGVMLFRGWRSHPVLGYFLFWIPVALAPVANVVVVTGVALAERTLFLPSVGASLIAGWLTDQLSAPWRTLGAIGVAAAVGAFAVRTWTRTPVWKDARVYALTLVAERPESYRGHWVAGRVLRAAGDLAGADRELTIARHLYGRDISLLRESAEVASALGRVADARRLTDSASTITVRRLRNRGAQ
ncbi:MAG: hypothetical protein ACT4P7_13715 [Gemmatimonadaceae bacterium]